MLALSDFLSTGLNHDTLKASIELCELGINPETPATLIKGLSSFRNFKIPQ